MPVKSSTYIEYVHPQPQPAPHTATQRMLINIILRTGLEDSRNFIYFFDIPKITSKQKKNSCNISLGA